MTIPRPYAVLNSAYIWPLAPPPRRATISPSSGSVGVMAIEPVAPNKTRNVIRAGIDVAYARPTAAKLKKKHPRASMFLRPYLSDNLPTRIEHTADGTTRAINKRPMVFASNPKSVLRWIGIVGSIPDMTDEINVIVTRVTNTELLLRSENMDGGDDGVFLTWVRSDGESKS